MLMQANSKRMDANPGRQWRLAAALCAAAGLALFAASAARAADRIYWSNYNTNTVSWANLDGSGGGELPTGAAFIDGPMGLAIDSASGRIYGGNYGAGGRATTIYWANLDGSGGGELPTGAAIVDGPHGAAIDRGARRIYWPNSFFDSSSISYANLDGSGGGQLNTGNADLGGPRGVALDRAAGKIYWANFFGETISYANLDGSGGGNINTTGATFPDPLTHEGPEGVALDPVAKRIYWGVGVIDTISYANLDGSGGGNLMTPGATSDHPHGVAIDPIARKIFWTNFDSNTISWANLDGSGGGELPIPGATPNGPAQPVLLETPVGAGAPALRGAFAPGTKLKCTQGAWADPVSSLDYRTPQGFSYSWRKNGKPIAGATSRSITARSLADYRCQVAAQNQAGSASQASGSFGVFRVGKPRLNSNGTASLAVTVPGRGTLTLSGKGVVKQRPARGALVSSALARKVKSGTVKLLVKAKRKAKKHLISSGRAKVKVKVTYRPRGGKRSSQTKTVKLKR
jgi:hypothetical protein